MIVSASDLQAAFEASGLERRGWTFERAMLDETIAWSLHHTARRAARNTHAIQGGHVDKTWNGTVGQNAPGNAREAATRQTATVCQAVQYGDTMCCGKCGVQWSTDDPEPPRCGTVDVKGLR